jgi:hypothetical protein
MHSADSPVGISSTPSTIRIDVVLRTVASFDCSFVNADIVRLSKRFGKTFSATGMPPRWLRYTVATGPSSILFRSVM